MSLAPAIPATSARRRAPAVSWSRRLRTVHLNLGALFAPSVIFFAATGALQLFNLHKGGIAYTPPAAIVQMSALHKRQSFGAAEVERVEAKAKARPAMARRNDGHAPDRIGTPFLKGLALATALSLIVSTLTGLWMAFRRARERHLLAGMLVLGLAAPLIAAFA